MDKYPVFYFFLILKTEIPKTTVVPITIIGLLIGSYFLPKESQTFLTLFKTWALPIIELFVLIFVSVKVVNTIKIYKELKDDSLDFYTALTNVCNEIFPPKFVKPVVTEVAVFYYGFVNWKSIKLKNHQFSYHKKSGTPALLGALIFIIGIETLALHLLIERWSVLIAWILTGLSLYSIIQLFGFAKSLSQRPITINNNQLILRYGILSETIIPLTDIQSIELSRKSLKKDGLEEKLSPLGDLDSHNVLIRLNKENEIMGLYGLKKQYKTIAFFVDAPKDFIENLNAQIN